MMCFTLYRFPLLSFFLKTCPTCSETELKRELSAHNVAEITLVAINQYNYNANTEINLKDLLKTCCEVAKITGMLWLTSLRRYLYLCSTQN